MAGAIITVRHNNGINALEEAVKEAAQRMGTLPSKRKVVKDFMPDLIITGAADNPHRRSTKAN